MRDVFEFGRSHAKRLLVSFVITIATASDIMSFIPLPGWVLLTIRILGGAAALYVLMVLAYRLGKFRQARTTTEAERAIKECSRYLRIGPQPIEYDVALVNRLTRAQWLRNHHGQWAIARVDADSQHLLLAGGANVGVIEGLIFSVLKVGNGIPCRCAVEAADITEDETRLRPAGFRIRAADQPASFLVDLVDPNPIEVGRPFHVELLVAGTLSNLGTK
jgi:hypothetical protein